MIRKLALTLILCLLAAPAWAQNNQCSNRPAGDSTNACANTRFVQSAIASGVTNNGNITYVDSGVGVCTAVGNGVTDDAPAIRACAAQVAAQTVGGAVGFSCNRTYLLGTRISGTSGPILQPYSNVTYVGCNASSVLKIADNMNTVTNSFYVFYPPTPATSIASAKFLNFKIDFNGANNSCGGTCYYNNIGIGIANGNNLVIDGVIFLNNPGSQDIAVNGVNGVGTVNGVLVTNTDHFNVCDVVNAACTDHSSIFVAANDYVISANRCRNSSQSTKSTCWEQWGVNGTASANAVDKYHRMANVPAITFGGSTTNQVITGNVGTSLGTGVVIWCDGASSSTISDIRIDSNSFNQQSGAGAFVFHDWDTTITADCAKNISYTNNTFTSSVAAGAAANPFTLRLGRAFNQVVSGNTFTGGGGAAIGNGTFSASTSFAITDNSITDAGQTSTAGGRRGILISSATAINKATVSRNQIQNVASTYMTTGLDLTINSINTGWVESSNLVTNVATGASLTLTGNMIASTPAGVMYNRGAGQPYGNTAAMTDGQLLVGQTGSAPLPKTMTNACALAASGALTCNIVSQISIGTGFSCSAIAQNTTAFTGTMGCQSATEASWQTPMTSAGSILGVRVFATSTPAAGQTFIMTIRKNTADTTITCIISNPATVCNDATHAVSYVAGDLLSLKIVTSATSGSVNAINASVTFISTN